MHYSSAERYCITPSSASVLHTQSILHSQVWLFLTLLKLSANRCDLLMSLSLFFVYSSSTYSPNYHAVKRESELPLGDPAALENERQIYKSVLEGGDIPFQGLSGLKRPSSSASTKGGWLEHHSLLCSAQCQKPGDMGKLLQGLESYSSHLRFMLSFLFAIPSVPSFFLSDHNGQYF